MRRFALPVLVVLAASARSEPITVYLAGDSTMAPKLPEKRPETGWGERLQGFFRVRIDNRVDGLREARVGLAELLKDDVKSDASAGEKR